MADILAGLRLTETVAAALRLASSRRPGGRSLDTQTLLLALESVDSLANWDRFHISDQPSPDIGGPSGDTWEQVPLTRECAQALSRMRVVAEAFHLIPVPPGALALALVWDATSGAGRSFVATTHSELVLEVQRELLGIELDNLSEVLSARTDLRPVGWTPSSVAHDAPKTPPTVSPHHVTAAQAKRALAQVVSPLPTWLLRIVVCAALAGIVLGLRTNPATTVHFHDDLTPPLARPAIADSIPDDATISRLLGTEFVRVMDGLPQGTKLFDSVVPFWYDVRHNMVDSAWAVRWDSSDGRSKVLVEVIRAKTVHPIEMGTHDCRPRDSGHAVTDPPVLRAGYLFRGERSAAYCSVAFDKQTKIFIEVQSTNPPVTDAVEARVAETQRAIQLALSTPTSPPLTRVPTPYSGALLNSGLFAAALALPLLWAVPTLLFDRATWQRLWWTLSLRRFQAHPRLGWDIDRLVRGRLWATTALACTQMCAAIWAIRVTSEWGATTTAISVVVVVLAISALPRLLYLRKAGRSQVFAGRRWLFWLVGTIVGVLAIGAAALVAWAANAVLVFGGPADMPDYMAQRLAIVTALLTVPAAMLAIVPIMLLRRFSMRLLRTQRSADTRDPILLLRSFADDDRRLRARSSHRRGLVDRLSMRKWERFEEILAASLGVHGPVYAAGQIGERLPPPLGAIRRQFTNAEWEARVEELMTGASVICVVLGRSDALTREIQRIAQLGFLPKTIFVLPPTTRKEHLKRLAVFAYLLRLDWNDLDVTVSGGRALAVRTTTIGGNPQVIHARAQEDVGYDIALELAQLGVAGFNWRTESPAPHSTPYAPRAEIYEPGEAPVFKSLFRRLTFWLIVLANTSIVGIAVTFVTGVDTDASNPIQLNSSHEWWAIAADPTNSNLYGVMDGVVLTRLDFEHSSTSVVCKIEAAGNIVAQSGWLYASNTVEGTLQAIDPVQGRVVWTLRDLAGLRGIAATDRTVFFVLPADREVRAVDRQSGQTINTRKVDAIPWASTLNGDNLLVSLIDASTVIEFDTRSLTETKQVASGIAATQLTSAAGTVWAYSSPAHHVVAISGPRHGTVIHTRSQDPQIASNGTILAIEAIESTARLWPDGTFHRALMPIRHANDLAVSPTGEVLAMTRDEVLLIQLPQR